MAMTENEAINELQSNIDLPFGFTVSDEVSEIAIQAIEEIKQYRAIGTVEELKSMKENGAFTGIELAQIATNQMELKKYMEIGTVEELKALKEKNEPKKPKFYAHNYYCTECGSLVGNNEFQWQRFLYCDHCGQKLDWKGGAIDERTGSD